MADSTVSRENTPTGQNDTPEEFIVSFLSGLLNAMELEGSIDIQLGTDQTIDAMISGPDSGLLIGRKGRTLEAIQELVRSAVRQRIGRVYKVTVDVEGYRSRRTQAVRDIAEEGIQDALDLGEVELEPMSPYDRKVVHDLVGDRTDVTSFSEGREPERRVVIRRLEAEGPSSR